VPAAAGQTSEQVEDVLFRIWNRGLQKRCCTSPRAPPARGSGSPIELHVSQRELGNFAGGSRESVNKILQSWHKAAGSCSARGVVIRNLAPIGAAWYRAALT